MKSPMWSVVIPTYNGGRTLRATITSLLAQKTNLPYEIIVVDNNSTDDTRDVIASFAARTSPEVRYVFEGEQGISAARNAGIAAAQGEVVAFTDDDCIPAPGWLDALAATYRARPDACCVGGKITLVLPEGCPPWLTSPRYSMVWFFASRDFGDGVAKMVHPQVLYGANFSVRRSEFSRIGLFDTGLGVSKSGRLGGEDIEFCRRLQRAGGTIYYCGQAVVRHTVNASRVTKQYFRLAAWQGGQTDSHPLLRNRLTIGEALRELAVIVRNCVKMTAAYALRHPAAFSYEVGVWRGLAYVWYGWVLYQQAYRGAKLSPTLEKRS